MAVWPTGIFTAPNRGTDMDDAVTHTDTHDAEQAEIIAIEQSLGVGVKGASATVAARFTALGASQTWSNPISGGITIGNGVVVSTYAQVGKMVVAQFRFTMGSTSAVTGGVGLTYPVTAGAAELSAATVVLLDFGTAWYSGTLIGGSAAGSSVNTLNVSGTYPVLAPLSSTVPFTWVASDQIFVCLSYVAA